ncbi:MAG: cold-shock protein [Chitinispirillaceae bacterium]|nr:cold-shock protein [Chitinispirillaceae bacterium]
MPMPRGTVRSFDYIHGTGFIDPEDGSEKVRVSYREITTAGYKVLHEGQTVSYDLHCTSRGPRARNVVPVMQRGR